VKRSPLRRRTPLRRFGRISPRSAKRIALDVERRAFVARILSERPRCEMLNDHAVRCHRASEHVHEKLTRARGGDILDPTNVLAVCFHCHRAIHDNPAWATAKGLLISSWEAGR
jgi:hypothetical protein